MAAQDTDRAAACEEAVEKLRRHLGKKPWDFAANDPSLATAATKRPD
jgi:hypothetical protein